jgi:hypothetical protein
MSELITTFLKNLGCSYCQEYEFQENSNKNIKENWKLYLKEYDMFSAMILYNEILDKNISYYSKIGDCISLLNENKDIVVKLEYLIQSDNAILVPTDEYQSFYESIEQMNKEYDPIMKAHYIGTYIIKN